MTAQRKIVVERRTASPTATGPFVVNLCSSTTPMALAHPQTPELKKFTFFMSRRREEGRERFRLHMGYFATLAEAEEWLNVVRDIFPGAWAGEAPGKKLAERAAATPAAAAPVPAPTPSAQPVVPTLQAAPTPAFKASQALHKPSAPTKVAPAPAPPKPAAPPAAPAKSRSLHDGSNVREVLNSLDDGGATRLMPSPAALPALAAASTRSNLSDSQVLKILENRDGSTQSRGSDEAIRGIELLRPDDTTTVRALKEAVQDNAPVSFAVQLNWSVQPIDLAKVPPLAIFSAYTLYTVEGSRDGRKWYGLRLGFFTDAVSAKQVASYVRSEFTSVAVIPVSGQERSRATNSNDRAGDSAMRSRRVSGKQADEFKLIDDVIADGVMPGLAAAKAQLQAKKPVARSISDKPGKRGRVRATEKRPPQTLEETLEILGASELEIDDGRGESLNDTGVRHLQVQRVQKNSPFAKLLERLSERSKKA